MKKALLVLTLALIASPAMAKSRDAYSLCLGADQVTLLNGSLEHFESLHARYGCNFLWARRDGVGYLVRDPEFLRKARDLFAPQRALKPEQKAVEREERELDREEERLEDREDRVSRERLREIHERQRVVAERERALDRREEELERVAEDQLWEMIGQAIKSGVAKRE